MIFLSKTAVGATTEHGRPAFRCYFYSKKLTRAGADKTAAFALNSTDFTETIIAVAIGLGFKPDMHQIPAALGVSRNTT